MAVVQYTFTYKQYTEQHNETEYLERNITKRIHKHNNKDISYTKLNIKSYKSFDHIYNDYTIEPKEYGRSSKTSYGLYIF